jgi:hypothetical protein
MAIFQGKLFCGTLPSGRIHTLEAGANATFDRALAPGWHHAAAVREGGRLLLYVDGKQAAASAPFDPADYDLTCAAPMRIGAGANDFFNGAMRDLRVYQRALTASEVEALAGM